MVSVGSRDGGRRQHTHLKLMMGADGRSSGVGNSNLYLEQE